MKNKIECCTCDSISGHGSCPIHKLDVMEMMLQIQLVINEGIHKAFEAGAKSIIEHSHPCKDCVPKENLKIWLQQFDKILSWHKERNLLPYDWVDYEHKKLFDLKKLLEEK